MRKEKSLPLVKMVNGFLIYAEVYLSKADALAREKRLKIHGSGKIELFKRLKIASLMPKLGRDAAKVSLATV